MYFCFLVSSIEFDITQVEEAFKLLMEFVKIDLICTKYTYSFYHTYVSLFLCELYNICKFLNSLGNFVYMMRSKLVQIYVQIRLVLQTWSLWCDVVSQ